MGAKNLNLTALMRAAKRRKSGNRHPTDEDSYYEGSDPEEDYEDFSYSDRDDYRT